MTKRGRLIVFEGADEVGKTTLAAATTASLRQQGADVISLAFPGAEPGTLGAHIYQLHHTPKAFGVETLSPESIQLLHIASHLDSLRRTILPALQEGKTVVMDRFWWSTMVYGIVAGADPATLEKMISIEKARWGKVLPEVVILVKRSGPLKPVENLPEWHWIQKEYAALAKHENGRHEVVTISNEGDLSTAIHCVEFALGLSLIHI